MAKVAKDKAIKIKKNSKTNGINGSPWSTFFLTAPYITLFFIFIALPVFISALLSLTYFNAIEAPSIVGFKNYVNMFSVCLLYTSPSPRDRTRSRMPSSA